jgi:hypothetical protein
MQIEIVYLKFDFRIYCIALAILTFDQVTYRLRMLLYYINILPILFIFLLYSIYAIFVYKISDSDLLQPKQNVHVHGKIN